MPTTSGGRVRKFRLGPTAVAAMLALAAAPASALAATTASVAGRTLTVQGDAAVNTLTIARSGTDIRVADTTGTVTPGAGCVADGASAARCAMSAIAAVDVLGGSGNDKISIDPNGGDLEARASLDGEAGDDELHGGFGDDFFLDEDGNDKYYGYNGDDLFIDGPGDDFYNGEFGADSFVDGPGNDAYSGAGEMFPEPKFDVVDFSASLVGVNVSEDFAANDGAPGEKNNVYKDIEVVIGTPFDDTISATEVGSGVTFVGLAGNDTFTGGGGDDVLDGGEGNDVLLGAVGDDALDGGDGADRLSGGPGDDSLDGGDGSDQLGGDDGDDTLVDVGGDGDLFGGAGEDTAVMTPVEYDSSVNRLQPVAVTVTLDDQANDGTAGEHKNVHSDVEGVVTGGANDKIVGSAAPNRIEGGAGNDQIDGQGGLDTLKGGVGDDRILSVDGGADVVDCADGTDTVGADSADTLLGCENVTLAPSPAAPDTIKPRLTVSARSAIMRAAFRRGIKVKVTTDEPATVTAELTAVVRTTGSIPYAAGVGDITIGRTRLPLGSGTRTLTLRPSRRLARSLRRKRLRLTIVVTAKDKAGNASMAKKRVRVR